MQKIRIDFDNPGLPQHISAVENDSQSRFFQATLYENGKAYTAPEGAAYSIMYRGFGPQNQGWYDTINDGAGKRAACAVSGNVVTCEIARQALQVPGHVSIVLCVTTGKGYMLKSWPIECDCKNDRYDSTVEIQSFFYVTQISNESWTQAIQAVEELKNTIDPTLTLSGKAADAAKVGEAVNAEAERAKGVEGQIKEDLDNLSIVKIGENKCTNKNEVYNSTIYLPVYLEKSKSYIIYNPTSETLKGCNINVVGDSKKDNILIAVKPTGWVTPNPKDKTQSFLSTIDDDWYKIRLSYQSVFTDEQKAMYETGWMVKEIPNIDYVPTSFDYVEYKEDVLAKESVNAEKASYAEKAGSIAQKEENVACIGDSLTYGYGANPGYTDYPTVLTKLCRKTVYNLGVSGESTDEILARQGGFPAVVNPANIPANTSDVEITFASTVNIGSENTSLLRKSSGNLVNPVVIDGVEGNISASNNKYYFTRLEAGEVHEVKRPQYVITKEMREHREDIQVIFVGTNGGWMITADDAETRIKKLTSQIDMMIDYNTSKKYIIIGMHYFYSWVLYNGLTKEQLENAMLLKYGNHYINLRKYMIEYGLADAGLTATEADTEAINNGNVPPSLLYSDGIHGNSYFYNILANLVNKKGIELGYWN